MSVLQRNRYLKKLRRYLTATRDVDFIKLLWAVDALQTGRKDAASLNIQFPEEAAATNILDKYAIRPWELETLFNQRLLLPKWSPQQGKNRILDCSQFKTLQAITRTLRTLENNESGIHLKRVHILTEMHRIGHRQFSWQRGYLNIPQFYRYAYLYNQGECANFFKTTYGVSQNDFSKVGFLLAGAFRNRPVVKHPPNPKEFGITHEAFEKSLLLLASDFDNTRRDYARLIESLDARKLGVAYQPSMLRRFPMIELNDGSRELLAPIPELIFSRITNGIYYDIIAGKQPLLNEASDRFEAYSAKFISALLPNFTVKRSQKYQVDGNNHETPDVIVEQDDTQIVVECKATKLSYPAQFGEAPLVTAKRGYDEIVKAVLQIWRFYAHQRVGAYANAKPNALRYGIVLTLDSWLVLSGELRKDIIGAAHARADDDKSIVPEDRRSVTFCTMEDLEITLRQSSDSGFLRVLARAEERKYEGWLLPHVLDDIEEKADGMKPFPFKLEEVLPWWGERPTSEPGAASVNSGV